MGDSKQRDAFIEQFVQAFRNQFAALIDGRDDEFGTRLLADYLPRHDIRMVLEVCNDNFVARLEAGSAPALRDKID